MLSKIKEKLNNYNFIPYYNKSNISKFNFEIFKFEIFYFLKQELTEINYDIDKKYIDDLLNIIDGNGEKLKNDSIKSYLKIIIPMLFFIAFDVISIIL